MIYIYGVLFEHVILNMQLFQLNLCQKNEKKGNFCIAGKILKINPL